MRKPIVAVIFAAACAASIVYGPVFYGIYLALDVSPSFSDVNRDAKSDRLPLKMLVARGQECLAGTPIEECEFHAQEELDSSPTNTTAVAKQ